MDYIHIGKIVATFGVQGEVILQHGLEKKSDFKTVEAIFIEQTKNNFLPYFLQKAKPKDTTESYLSLEGVSSKEAAHRFIRKNVWLLKDDFEKVAGKASAIGLIGFQIFDREDLIGIVEEVIEQPHQLLLKTSYKSKEALIPLHEETIDFIDRKKKEIHVVLPDGLLAIYE